ncbi:MAG: hypothetical protein JW790_05300 [Dehalococcoidales bacterium]|nr:hypothetical protein [Dehalococcoidales bacterium]
MKRLSIIITAVIVAVLVLATGCFLLPEGVTLPEEETPSEETLPEETPTAGNQTPTAFIDAITPPTAAAGDEVRLQGHGTDTDGTVVAYRWRSSIDGPLGVEASMATNGLSVGEHDIFFKVQDNNGGWSEEVVGSVVITPAEAPVPLEIVSFTATADTINLGDTTTLGWEVTGADEVTIEPDIGIVARVGTIDVSPEVTTSYMMTATRGTQTEHEVAKITVLLPNSYSETLTAVPLETTGIFDGSPPMVWPPGSGLSVGDYNADLSMQGFASFDISTIPEDAVITSVEVDFSAYSGVGGNPFADLGCLRVYLQNFGTLDSGDFFTGTPTGEILKYCSEAEIVPHESASVRDALQHAVGHDRFQVRFQFNELDSNHDGSQDYIHWDPEELVLNIEYESYE